MQGTPCTNANNLAVHASLAGCFVVRVTSSERKFFWCEVHYSACSLLVQRTKKGFFLGGPLLGRRHVCCGREDVRVSVMAMRQRWE